LAEVTGDATFQLERIKWRKAWAEDLSLAKSTLETLLLLEKHRYAYQWNWMGIPIIKMPEEILLLQEAISKFKPTAIVEIGVARGGGVAFYHSVQMINSIKPNVLGVDIHFFPHTRLALDGLTKSGLTLREGASTSGIIRGEIEKFLMGHDRTLVVLDGDHSHENVLKELVMFDEILEPGAILLCADTWLSLIPQTGVIRNWDPERNPKSALVEFMSHSKNWEYLDEFCERVLLSESPNGWIHKVS